MEQFVSLSGLQSGVSIIAIAEICLTERLTDILMLGQLGSEGTSDADQANGDEEWHRLGRMVRADSECAGTGKSMKPAEFIRRFFDI